MTHAARPRIAISLGDPCGIGAEVLVRALATPTVRSRLTPLVFGDPEVWARAVAVTGVDPGLPTVEPGEGLEGGLFPVTSLSETEAPWGGETEASARAQLAYLDAAIDAVQTGRASALCTAPITKAAVAAVGFSSPGHTEYLQQRAGAPRVTMMFAGPQLRVALVTTHLALRDVPGQITVEAVEETTRCLERALRRWWGVETPRIAVCGLNPHAGERGRMGEEDGERIHPAIEALRDAGLDARGPVAADAAMALAARGRYDGVVAMYHDQALPAVKALHFEEAVNVTLGLPYPRTSPDHGSALDIAGRGEARAEGMVAALLLAARMAEMGEP